MRDIIIVFAIAAIAAVVAIGIRHGCHGRDPCTVDAPMEQAHCRAVSR